jgi:ferredoxin-NADP reductase
MSPPLQPAVLLRTRTLSPRVREFVFLPRQRIEFRPGQFVSLQLPVGPKPPLVRAYSMAEPQQPSGELVLALDLVPDGLGSTYLFGLQEGAEVTMSGPYGNFTIPEPPGKDLLLLARFTGIVPIRCMLKDLFSRPLSREVTLVYSSPGTREQIYHEEFLALSAAHANFHYLPRLLPPGGPGDPELDVLAELIGGRRDVLPVACGVKAFVGPIRTSLKEMGFDRREMRLEAYD